MSKLYIANTTKKLQIFHYRMPEDPRPQALMIHIRPGGQEVIPYRDLSPQAVEAIVAPHRPYGLISVDEVPRHKPFVGMCYSVDKPVPLERIQVGLKHNDELLAHQGRETRIAAAVALNNAIEQQTGQQLSNLEISIEEENPEKHQGEGDALGRETLSVSREADPTKPIVTRGKKPTRRAA